jgi:hypothetical protein
MDKKSVFVKTKEGEDAVRQRTRLVQRNLRNILIMVDGQATLADLAKRFGDENATRTALADLVNSGLIREMEQGIPADDEAADQTDELPVLTAQVEPEPIETPSRPPAHSIPPPVIEEIVLPAPEYESLPPAAPYTLSKPEPQPEPAAGSGWQDKFKALVAGLQGSRSGGARDVALEPIRRDTGLKIGLPLLALISLVGLAVLAGLTFALYPYGRHLPDIERNASAMLKQPVKIGDIGFSFLPRPHISLRSITIGKEAGVRIAGITAVPEFMSLAGDRQVFSELTIERASIAAAELGRLASASSAGGNYEIRRIRLVDASLIVGDARIGGISGEVKMKAGGAPEKIQLQNAEATLRLELQPQGRRFSLLRLRQQLESAFQTGSDIPDPGGPGRIAADDAGVERIDARAYEGLVEGKASLDWAAARRLAGDLELKRMNATRLLAGLGFGSFRRRGVDGPPEIGCQGGQPRQAGRGVAQADGTFEMKRGVARGLDLGEAVRSTGRGPTRGGETKFEQLSGSFSMDPQDSRLGNLRLSSGLLKAGGSLGVARERPIERGHERRTEELGGHPADAARRRRHDEGSDADAEPPLATSGMQKNGRLGRPFCFGRRRLFPDDSGDGVGDVVDVL